MRRVIAALALVLSVIGGTRVAWATWGDTDTAAASYSSAVLAAPTGPSTSAGTCVLVIGDAINVTWTPTASTWADGYQIARSLVSGGPYTVVATVTGQGTSTYLDSALLFSTTYHYVVRATKGQWRSVDSAQVSRTTKNVLCV